MSIKIRPQYGEAGVITKGTYLKYSSQCPHTFPTFLSTPFLNTTPFISCSFSPSHSLIPPKKTLSHTEAMGVGDVQAPGLVFTCSKRRTAGKGPQLCRRGRPGNRSVKHQPRSVRGPSWGSSVRGPQIPLPAGIP